MKNPVQLVIATSLMLATSATLAATLTVQVSDGTGAPLVDVVVVAAPDGGGAMPRVMKPGEIEQRGLKFMPLVSVVQTGSSVSFPNYDKVKHHIYSFSPAKKFDQKLYSGVAAAPQVFDKAGIVVLGCNIHDRMVSYIKVVDSPYFAKSGADGVARIEVPGNGKYTVSAWHYNMVGAAAEQAVSVKGESAGAINFKLALKPVAVEVAGRGY